MTPKNKAWRMPKLVNLSLSVESKLDAIPRSSCETETAKRRENKLRDNFTVQITN